MSNKEPKIILKVDLLNNFGVEFTLLQLRYLKDKPKDDCFITEKMWIFYYGKQFKVFKTGTMVFPETCLRQTSKLNFESEKQRYMYLKKLSNALNDFGKSYLFNKSSETFKQHLLNEIYQKPFSPPSKINFLNKIWLVL